ncbi:hypothetical protein BCR44DRAFT_1443151 [Catenaria anguillulae PL171]|uniref:Uncharacterized protein n=1 Tax=Catenaria anguillulae PL171 TaxID=765915 RepID=A0A1Y2H992_9FUNG|nr:hypothetical protein BCR44DRAFT_1443151 [Catenaria anguillulae PL171]
MVVNFGLLVSVLMASSKYFQVTNNGLEVISVIYVLLMFATAMTTSIIQRRFNVNDRASLHLSNHRLIFTFFSMASLRLRPRVFVCIIGLAMCVMGSASWALVPSDRMVDMLGIQLPTMLAALGSTTLCFMFESASRRYFWIKHCAKPVTFRGKKEATLQPGRTTHMSELEPGNS